MPEEVKAVEDYGIFESSSEVEILRGDIAIHLGKNYIRSGRVVNPRTNQVIIIEIADMNELVWLLLGYAKTNDDFELIVRVNNLATHVLNFSGKSLNDYDRETLAVIEKATQFFIWGNNLRMHLSMRANTNSVQEGVP